MSAAHTLVLMDTGWQFQAIPVVEATVNHLSIEVEGVLLPPNANGAGIWVGHVAEPPMARYAGWGQAANHLSIKAGHLLPLSDEASLLGALLLPASCIAAALRNLLPVTCATVVGKGLLATLVEKLLRSRGVSIREPENDADLDLVVDTTGEPDSWGGNLHSLRRGGTILLIVPPWSEPAGFDFYPYVHRRSLSVVAQRWHRLPGGLAEDSLGNLQSLVSTILKEKQWVHPLDLACSTAETEVWHWFDWSNVKPTNLAKLSM